MQMKLLYKLVIRAQIMWRTESNQLAMFGATLWSPRNTVCETLG